jgi:hypothetical protein
LRQAASAAETDLIATLRDADDWDRVAETETGREASGRRIRVNREPLESQHHALEFW